MKITRCATAVVEANYDYTYVRIHADDGAYGTGECFFAAGLTAALREMFPSLAVILQVDGLKPHRRHGEPRPRPSGDPAGVPRRATSSRPRWPAPVSRPRGTHRHSCG